MDEIGLDQHKTTFKSNAIDGTELEVISDSMLQQLGVGKWSGVFCTYIELNVDYAFTLFWLRILCRNSERHLFCLCISMWILVKFYRKVPYHEQVISLTFRNYGLKWLKMSFTWLSTWLDTWDIVPVHVGSILHKEGLNLF